MVIEAHRKLCGKTCSLPFLTDLHYKWYFSLGNFTRSVLTSQWQNTFGLLPSNKCFCQCYISMLLRRSGSMAYQAVGMIDQHLCP